MLNVMEKAFEDSILEEKDLRDARARVRIEMRRVFHKKSDEFEQELPPDVKPYIPPTPMSDDPMRPFGGALDPPLGG